MNIQNDFKINIVILSENEENSKNLAEMISHTKVSEAEIWHEHREGVNIFTYIRWPGCKITAAPIGITDILIVYLSQSDYNIDQIRKYVDERKSVPFKYLISKNDMTKLSQELNLQFFLLDDIKNEKEKIIKFAINEEKALREVFNRMDLDENGSINEKEILSISKVLNHPLNDEDAKEIIKLLSNQGRIFYDKFKQWWVMGRTDFNQFRRLVQIEMFFNNIHKSKKEIDNYLATFINEAKTDLLQSNRVGIINIKPEKDFDSKISINAHVTMGKEYNEITKTLPHYLEYSSINFGFELHLRNDNDGPKVIETLNDLKNDLISNNPNLKWIDESLFNINFRHVATSVFIDFSPKSGIDDQTQSEFIFWDIFEMAYSGYLDLHFCTQLSVWELTTMSFEHILRNLCNIKLEIKSEYPQQKNIFDYILENLMNCINNDTFRHVMKFLATSQNYNLSFSYLPKNMKSVIFDFMESYSEIKNFENKENLENNWNQVKKKCKSFIKENMDFFNISFFKKHQNVLYYLFLDNQSFYLNSPVMKVYTKINFIFDDLFKSIEKNLKS